MTVRLIAPSTWDRSDRKNLQAEVTKFIKEYKVKATVWAPSEVVVDLEDNDPSESMIAMKFPEFKHRRVID